MVVDCVWNVKAHAQKPDFVFLRNGRVHLNRQGRQFSRLLAAEVRVSAVVMLDKICSEVVWRVLATHYIRQVPLHFPILASPCAITFQLDSTCAFKLQHCHVLRPPGVRLIPNINITMSLVRQYRTYFPTSRFVTSHICQECLFFPWLQQLNVSQIHQ